MAPPTRPVRTQKENAVINPNDAATFMSRNNSELLKKITNKKNDNIKFNFNPFLVSKKGSS